MLVFTSTSEIETLKAEIAERVKWIMLQDICALAKAEAV